MKRVMFFVDGFNLYHSLNKKEYSRYKWLNLRKLCQCFIDKNTKITGIKYFTAYAFWMKESMERHKTYIKALGTIDIEIVYGKFKSITKKCPECKKEYPTHIEKRTDVNIAMNLFISAMKDEYDKGIIVSGDSDLIPAIKYVKSYFPTKEIGVLIPIGRQAEELKNVCDFHMRIKEKHLSTSQFDDIITLSNNVQIRRPKEWT